MADKFHIDIKAFLHGYKPAFLFNPLDIPRSYQKSDLERLGDYPYIDGITLTEGEQILYFQSEIGKRAFLKQTQELAYQSAAFQKELGLAIGFPPQAVHFYVEWMERKQELSPYKIQIQYSGIHFITGIHQLVEDVTWLWNKYPYPFFTEKPIEVLYDYHGIQKTYDIPYQDQGKLDSVHTDLQQTTERY